MSKYEEVVHHIKWTLGMSKETVELLEDYVELLEDYADLLAAQEKSKPVAITAKQLSIGGVAPNGTRFETGDYPTAIFYKPLPIGTKLYAHPPAQAWIPVTERLPDGNQEVLVFPGWATGGERPHIEQYSAQYKCFLMEIEDGKRVTHWQPLPPAPKGE